MKKKKTDKKILNRLLIAINLIHFAKKLYSSCSIFKGEEIRIYLK